MTPEFMFIRPLALRNDIEEIKSKPFLATCFPWLYKGPWACQAMGPTESRPPQASSNKWFLGRCLISESYIACSLPASYFSFFFLFLFLLEAFLNLEEKQARPGLPKFLRAVPPVTSRVSHR